MNAVVTNYKDSPMSLQTVTVLGVSRTVSGVNVNGQAYSSFRYNGANNVCIESMIEREKEENVMLYVC